MAIRYLSKQRPDRQPQIRIIDQVVLGVFSITPGGKRQPFGLLGMQNPQPLLDRHALNLRRRARELFRGRDALQVLPQIGGQGVLPAGTFLELRETTRVSGEAQPQVVEQKDRSEGERFQRVERIVRTGYQVRHLPQGVQMGDVVDGEVGQIAVDLAG